MKTLILSKGCALGKTRSLTPTSNRGDWVIKHDHVTIVKPVFNPETSKPVVKTIACLVPVGD